MVPGSSDETERKAQSVCFDEQVTSIGTWGSIPLEILGPPEGGKAGTWGPPRQIPLLAAEGLLSDAE